VLAVAVRVWGPNWDVTYELELFLVLIEFLFFDLALWISLC
jgi:hypothetical protein